MPNPYDVPEINVQDVAAKRAGDTPFLLLDVREEVELNRVNLGEGVTHVPLSVIGKSYQDALPDEIKADKEAEIIVFCHHGGRSAQVAAWLLNEGWKNVFNMAGGIDAYARVVDPAIGRY